MRMTTRKLIDAKQTGRYMHALVNKYYRDMAPWAVNSYPEFFRLMANIPFNPDPPDKELLKRPLWTMHQIGPGGDCDDKSIAVASWAKISGIPYRFVGVGMKVDRKIKILLSHVYPELFILGKWMPFDNTYAFNILGKPLIKYDKHVLL